ncbi:MAG: LysR family transcriptional regulator [Eggerthellaceae bacterium]
MNMQYLSYFVELAHSGSYTSAAKKLYVAQPSLTYGIKALEQELGCKLVEASKKGIVLTKFGKAYLSYAQSAMTSLDKGQETVSAILRGSDQINIAVTQPMSVTQVPEILSRFSKSENGKNITYDFQLTSASQGAAMVADGRADIGFVGKESIRLYDNLRYCPLAYDRLYIITSANHGLALRNKVTLKDLFNYPYIGWSEQTGLHDILKEAFEQEVGAQPLARVEVADSYIAAGMVAAGFGVAVCPEIPYMSYLNIKKINPHGKRWIRPFGLIYKNESRQIPIIKNFISFVEQHIKDPVFVYAHVKWDS